MTPVDLLIVALVALWGLALWLIERSMARSRAALRARLEAIRDALADDPDPRREDRP